MAKFDTSYTFPDISETDVAYIAGFIDGEGTISKRFSFHSTSGNGIYSYSIQIGHTHLDTLHWIQKTLNAGKVYKRNRTPSQFLGNKQQWVYKISVRYTVHKVLLRLMPYLRVKAKDMILEIEEKGGQSFG